MQHWLPPCVKEKEIWAWWEGAFTDKELDWLQQKARESTIEGKAGGEVKEETRRNKIDWLRNTPDTSWVFAENSVWFCNFQTPVNMKVEIYR